jgi:hypothetical protein
LPRRDLYHDVIYRQNELLYGSTRSQKFDSIANTKIYLLGASEKCRLFLCHGDAEESLLLLLLLKLNFIMRRLMRASDNGGQGGSAFSILVTGFDVRLFFQSALSFLEALISFIFIVRAAAAHAHVSGDPLFVCLAIFTLSGSRPQQRAHTVSFLCRAAYYFIYSRRATSANNHALCVFFLFICCLSIHTQRHTATSKCIEKSLSAILAVSFPYLIAGGSKNSRRP